MIQRLQTIYLALSALSFGSLFMFPFATSDKPVPFMLNDMVYNIQDSPILLGLTVLGLILTIVGIFLYKNRKLQSKLAIFSIISAVFILLVAILLMYNEGTSLDSNDYTIDDEAGIFSPIIALVFSFLAYRGIQKDRKIVSSMDRLR